MKRGTPAWIAASSRTVCVSTITSRNPASADTTQDAPEHAGVTWEALLKSTLAIVTPSSCSRSSLSRAVPWRTSAFTPAPRSSKALAMRPPRLPVAPATTMIESFRINLLPVYNLGFIKLDAETGQIGQFDPAVLRHERILLEITEIRLEVELVFHNGARGPWLACHQVSQRDGSLVMGTDNQAMSGGERADFQQLADPAAPLRVDLDDIDGAGLDEIVHL